MRLRMQKVIKIKSTTKFICLSMSERAGGRKESSPALIWINNLWPHLCLSRYSAVDASDYYFRYAITDSPKAKKIKKNLHWKWRKDCRLRRRLGASVFYSCVRANDIWNMECIRIEANCVCVTLLQSNLNYEKLVVKITNENTCWSHLRRQKSLPTF